jgi:hypothetical protein
MLLHVGSAGTVPEAALLNRGLEQIARVARVEWLLLGAGVRTAMVEPAGLSPHRLAERACVTLASPPSGSRPRQQRPRPRRTPSPADIKPPAHPATA